jgi:tetratricopeptide (TPR) repeat protein
MKNLIALICFLFTFAISGQTASEYFNQAKEQASKRKYYQAIPNYKKAIAIDSTNLEYHWFLSEAILKENIRGANRTDVGVFDGLAVLQKMISKGAASVKVYERIATSNEYVLDDYYNRYKNFRAPTTESWQDETPDTSEKERFKSVALNAHKEIVASCNEMLKLDAKNEFALSKLKYLKEPKF